jgi:hypothetical protein
VGLWRCDETRHRRHVQQREAAWLRPRRQATTHDEEATTRNMAARSIGFAAGAGLAPNHRLGARKSKDREGEFDLGRAQIL